MRTKLMTLAAENGFSHAAPGGHERADAPGGRCGRCAGGPVRTVERQLACPPGCGTLEDAAAAMGCFDAGVLVQTTGTLTDDFDYEGMEAIQRRHKRAFADFARQARLLLPDCLPLSAGACTVCRRCTCPDRPCRFPDQADVLYGGLRTVGGGRVSAVRAVV